MHEDISYSFALKDKKEHIGCKSSVLLIDFSSLVEDHDQCIQSRVTCFTRRTQLLKERRHHPSPDFNEAQIYMAPPLKTRAGMKVVHCLRVVNATREMKVVFVLLL